MKTDVQAGPGMGPHATAEGVVISQPAGKAGGRGRGQGRGGGNGRGHYSGAAALDRDVHNAFAEADEVAGGDDAAEADDVAQGLEAMKRAIGEAAAPLIKGSRLRQIIEWLKGGDGDPLMVFDVRRLLSLAPS